MVFCNKTDDYLNGHQIIGHNPYFNRWFSAIEKSHLNILMGETVTILILIDGFLQSSSFDGKCGVKTSQSLF